MSRTGYGLHKLTGGIRAMWREAWETLPTKTCPLRMTNTETGETKLCGQPATGLIQTWDNQFRPICTEHTPRARELGYTVHEPPGPEALGRRVTIPEGR
jgi:hypothetical protein